MKRGRPDQSLGGPLSMGLFCQGWNPGSPAMYFNLSLPFQIDNPATPQKKKRSTILRNHNVWCSVLCCAAIQCLWCYSLKCLMRCFVLCCYALLMMLQSYCTLQALCCVIHFVNGNKPGTIQRHIYTENPPFICPFQRQSNKVTFGNTSVLSRFLFYRAPQG